MAKWIVSVKGVLLDGDRVLLAFNDRDEWELPGGQLEPGEQPVDTLVREFAEETGLTVRVGPLLDAHRFEVIPGASVVIIAHLCERVDPTEVMEVSQEHSRLALHPVDGLDRLPLPDGYRRVIRSAVGTTRHTACSRSA